MFEIPDFLKDVDFTNSSILILVFSIIWNKLREISNRVERLEQKLLNGISERLAILENEHRLFRKKEELK